MPYASNDNAVLIDGCNNLKNFTVLLWVLEDIATTSGDGWNLQLNCYPPPGWYCQTSQVNWVQYIVAVQGGNLYYYIQYWSIGASLPWPPGYSPEPGTTPWLPCWAHDYGNSPFFASGISKDTLPHGSKLGIAMATDEFDRVTAVTFSYTDPDGKKQEGVWRAQAVLPVCACELNFVGSAYSRAVFTQEVTNPRGVIYYSVSPGQLSNQNGPAGFACGETGATAIEESNMTYSDIYDAPSSSVTQYLQQTINCAIEDVFLGEQPYVGEMKELRDSQIAKYPAGQWLMEVLDRYSAHLALIVASDEDGLARPVRDLLTKAVQTAREGRVFDDATIDEALKVLGQISCKLPRSMYGIGPAGATVLRSLRGRTFEDGLKEASMTIRPRFRQTQT